MAERLGISSRAIIGKILHQLKMGFGADWAALIGMLFGSDQESETYKWLGATPAMREWVGGRQAKGLRTEGMTITNKLWEATLEIALADMRRDKTGQIDVRIADLVRRSLRHWRSLLSTLIVNGTGSTNGLCYDGQYFFDDDHESGDSGAQKNLLTSSEVAQLDVTTAAAPTESEMAQAVLNVIAYILGYKDDQGEPCNEDATEFLVMTPTNLWGAAQAAVSKALLNTGSGAVDNPLKNAGFNVSVASNARFTTTTVFYVFRTDDPVKPFILQEETETKVAAIAEGSELEFNENKHHYGVSASRNVGYAEWRRAAHCTLV